MTTEEYKRINWHLDLPLMNLLSGIRRHLALISMHDLQLLCRFFATSINNLEEKLWFWIKWQKPSREFCGVCNGKDGGCNRDGLCEPLLFAHYEAGHGD
jgi:hypothetical protein